MRLTLFVIVPFDALALSGAGNTIGLSVRKLFRIPDSLKDRIPLF